MARLALVVCLASLAAVTLAGPLTNQKRQQQSGRLQSQSGGQGQWDREPSARQRDTGRESDSGNSREVTESSTRRRRTTESEWESATGNSREVTESSARRRTGGRAAGGGGSIRPLGRCSENDNIFKSGQSYDYKYFGKAETGLGFGDAKTVGLAMDCHITLSVPQPCEYSLRIRNCQAYEHDGSEDDSESEGHRSLEDEVRHLDQRSEVSRRGFQPSDRSTELNKMVSQYAIQAQVEDGEVARVIYDDEEEVWVVNFKKAILDALQVATSSGRSRYDLKNGIQGLCPTRFAEQSTTEHVIIEKDLDACIQSEKTSWTLSPLTPVWNMSWVAKVMDAESVCSYKMERGSHIRSMTCREVHHLLTLPYTNVQAATANVTQTLRFVGKTGSAEGMERSLSGKTVTGIVYEHENVTDIDRKNGQGEADEILKDLVQKTTDGLDISTPALFDDFVDELRDSSDLSDVLATVQSLRDNDQEIGKYLLVQGLIQCNAPACLRALNTLIQSDEIPAIVFEPVVMALALSKQQDPLFLDEVRAMCQQRPTRTCTLMLGALAYELVDDNEEILSDPKSAEPIEKSAEFLMNLIDDQCQPSSTLDKADEESDWTKVILALKALGNLGSVAQKVEASRGGRKVEEKIWKCLTDSKTPDNVTVAAIHAFRRFVPSQQISSHLLTVLADHEESVEVRMAACMASVRMAADKTAVRSIVKVMEQEKVDQLKAFMVSHLRTVLKSEDPNYKEVAEHLREILAEKGLSDLPKIRAPIPYSLHVELSKFYQVPFLDDEDNDFGAQIEAAAMFSPKSLVPRSLQLNISTAWFGDYVNLIETGVDMSGAEELVEKIVGPRGVLAKSKLVKKAKEFIVKALQMAEEMGLKHLRLEDAQKFAKKMFDLVSSKEYKEIFDTVLSTLQDLDTSSLTQMFSHLRSMDIDRLVDEIKRAIPSSAHLNKVMEKLKRISYRDATKETLIEVLEAFGINPEKSREIIHQAKQYGVDIDRIVAWVKKTDFRQIQDQLQKVRLEDFQEKYQVVVRQVKKVLDWITEKFNLPSVEALIDMAKQALKNPEQAKGMFDQFTQSGKQTWSQWNDSEDDDEDESTTSRSRNDDDDEEEDASDRRSRGRNTKSNKKSANGLREGRTGMNDDDDVDFSAFLRLFGNEIGFITLDDITDFLDMSLLQDVFAQSKGRWADIMDGFDIAPTAALKMEGLHHVATGLGLPLQITFNVTGMATLHLKMQPEGGSLKQSALAIEPSAALQVTGGMAIDLPSITSVAVVSNTTVASEFELRVRLNVRQDSIELDIEKPDEELDIIRIRHEVKLVKDEEDFEPFDNAKSHEVRTEKCLPEMVERVTGLKVCAELETSSMKGTALLSHGPHDLRVYIEESEKTGLQHIKFAGKRHQQPTENRYEFNVRAPGHQLQREGRALITHDRQRNHIQADFSIPEQTSPRAQLFFRQLDREDAATKFGIEAGIDVQVDEEQHYNVSVMALAKVKGYSSGSIVEMIKDARFNYTVGFSVQAPMIALNVSTTTAKDARAIFMEHNITYFIADEVRSQALKKLRFPHAEQRDGVSKFCLRHGVWMKRDSMATDVQAFLRLMTFPLLEVAEPTVLHISQIKVHRDWEFVGVHSNTTWLNEHDEVEFFNISATANNLPDVMQLTQRIDPISVTFNVSRNDWHVAVENELEKTAAGEFTLTNEMTAMGQYPEGRSTLDCLSKRLMADLKAVAAIRKVKSVTDANHAHRLHKIRRAPRPDDAGNFRHRELMVTLENKIKEKSASNSEEGFWNQRTSRAGGMKAYEVKTRMEVLKNGGQRMMEVRGVSHFGNDAKDRDALVSLYFVHNATATNIPFSFDHFSHLLLSPQRGLEIVMNTSIDKNDDTFFGIGSRLAVNPQRMSLHAGLEIDTPFLDHTAQCTIRPAGSGQVEITIASEAESDSGMERHKTGLLAHKLSATTKMSLSKMSQSLRFRHAKLESDFKVDLNIFGRNMDSGVDMESEDEDDEENQVEVMRNDRAGKKNAEQRRRSPRSIQSRNAAKNRLSRDEEGDNENDQDSESWTARSATRRRSANFQRRPTSNWDDEASSDFAAVFGGKSRHTFDSIKSKLSQLNPTMTSNLRVKSRDTEIIPSFTVTSKMSPRYTKVDVKIQECPQEMDAILKGHKEFTVEAKADGNQAVLIGKVAGKGEAGMKIQLKNEKLAEARIYDHGLLKTGVETVYAQITLELPTEKQIRSKFFINRRAVMEAARAAKDTAKTTGQAVFRLIKETSNKLTTAARRIYSDASHPLYDFIRPFYKGSMQQWKNELVEKIKEMKRELGGSFETMYGDSEFFGMSGKEMVRKGKETAKNLLEWLRELVDQTPIGAVIEVLPSNTELFQRIERILNKHFARQVQIIQQGVRAVTIQWDSYDAFTAWEKTFDVLGDLKDSIAEVQTRELAEQATQVIRDLLVETIRMIREQVQKSGSPGWNDLLEKLKLDEWEREIRSGSVDYINLLAEVVGNWEALLYTTGLAEMTDIVKMEGDKLVVTVPHPFRWTNLKELPKLDAAHEQQLRSYMNQSRSTFRDLFDDDNVRVPVPGHEDGVNFKWSDVKKAYRKHVPSSRSSERN